MSKKVLICDDDLDILEVTKIILQMKGFSVETRINCNHIFETVEEIKPDVILMDLWIPEIGGEAATSLLKNSEKTKGIPIILFSANNNLEKIAQSCGANHFLSKPFDINELEAVLEKFTG